MSEFIDDVQARFTAALQRLGVSETVASMVGAELMADVARSWHGKEVYIGKRDIERALIKDEVRRRFNGRNACELAREFGIGKVTVYRYLKIAGR